jgi:hypothetical protein
MKLTKKKPTLRDEVDPILRDVIGVDDRPPGPRSNELPDPVGDFFHEVEFGIPRPRNANDPAPKVAAPLSRAEIAEALTNLQKHLGAPGSGFRSTKQLVAKLAEAAEDHLEPDNPIRSWLIAYTKGDQEAMRTSIKTLVAKSRNEIVEYARRSQDVSMQRGTPNAVVKKGGWTYKYDSAGSLQACFEGDDEPFIFKN